MSVAVWVPLVFTHIVFLLFPRRNPFHLVRLNQNERFPFPLKISSLGVWALSIVMITAKFPLWCWMSWIEDNIWRARERARRVALSHKSVSFPLWESVASLRGLLLVMRRRTSFPRREVETPRDSRESFRCLFLYTMRQQHDNMVLQLFYLTCRFFCWTRVHY